MKKKSFSKKDFVNAVRAKGGVKYFDLGGRAGFQDSLPKPPGGLGGSTDTAEGLAGQSPTPGGIAGLLTPMNQYEARLAPTTFNNYNPIVNTAAGNSLAGVGQYNTNLSAEQALAEQLKMQAAGQGPNPTQAQLAQNTQNNVANQAALMASQRGASSNVGLLARQAANTGAAAQQASVGQAATLQAQQQLEAQKQLQAQQGQMGSQIAQQQGVSNQLFGYGANAANTQNANIVSNYGTVQGINAATAAQNANAAQDTTGGLISGLGTALAVGAMMLAEGGPVEGPSMITTPAVAPNLGEPSSFVGKFLRRESKDSSKSKSSFNALGSGLGSLTGGMIMEAKGGKVPAMVSPGEVYLPPSKAKEVAHGKASPMAGEHIKGKAKVKGDSLKNDVVPKLLDEGGVVIPRSVMQSPNAAEKAAKFVAAVMAKQKNKRA